MADFNLGRLKFNWKGAWTTTTSYVKDDVVRSGANTYVCLLAHTAGTFSTDLSANKWELMIPGNSGSPLTTDGDLYYFDGSTDSRLPIGSPGQALIVNDAGFPSWQGLTTAQSIYYVKADGDDSNNGTNLNEAFKTIRHACDTVTGPATIYVKGGLYYEVLPITVPANVTIVGDGQRTTGVAPVNITNNSASIAATTGAQTSTTIVIDDSADVGGTWTIGDTITISNIQSGSGITGTVTITDIDYDTPIVGNSRLTVSFSSQTVTATDCTISSDYSEGTMWLLNDGSTLNKMYFRDMGGFAPNLSSPEDITASTSNDKGIFVALDPANTITSKSPYVIECSAFSDTGGIGAVVDGDVHSGGNKSIVFHGYTVILDDGVGFWVNGQGKAEIVSCFTYFCWFGYVTTNGGKIRALNGNNSYGTYGVVSRGFDPDETSFTGAIYGNQLAYNPLTLVGEFSVGNTITGGTSGATGTITNVQSAVNKLYYVNTNGFTFQAGETITASGGKEVVIETGGVTGQKGFVLVADGFLEEPRPGGAIQLTGDPLSYIIQSVSGTYTNTSSVMTIVLANEKPTASVNNTALTIRYAYSQSRLTGHDFLSIGTGGKATTNYPGEPTQASAQGNEVIESYPGRVFYVSTDQDGNFRVGDYFRVDQATGRATLNASAFDLSGLTSLRLGSIGAQLGELVNEFSSDTTMSGDSNEAVPTEAAVRGYFENIATNVAPVNDNILTLGTPTNRWNHVYVGPGSITLGTLTITDNAGTLEVTAGGNAAPTLINAINNGTSNVSVAEDADITITSNSTLAATFSGANTTLAGELRGPSTFTIDPAVVGDDTGTVIIKGNLQVDGTTTTINSTTLTVDDKNIVLASGAANDAAADGAGITVESGSGNKTLNWVDSTDAWTSSEHLNLASGKSYYINGTSVLSSTTLGSGVTSSSLTSVGTLTSLTISGDLAVNGADITTTETGTAAVFNTNATTINFAGAATTINIGATSGSTTNLNGILAIKGSSSGSVKFQAAAAAGSVTYTLPSADGSSNQALVTNGSGTLSWATIAESTAVNKQVNSLGVGTAGSGTAGEIRATNAITAYYSDDNLKTRLGNIENALDKIDQLAGFYYEANDVAVSLGYERKREVGLSAQSTQKVLPEVVVPAPIDPEKYLTIHYDRVIPLLVEGIKELRKEINSLKGNK